MNYGGRFGDLWLLLTGLMLLVSVVAQQVSLFMVGAVLLATAGISRLWERYCLSRIEYSRTIAPARAFPGEAVELHITLVNRKPLPLAWLEVEDEVPDGIAFSGDVQLTSSFKTGRRLLGHLLALRWYERVIRTYRFTAPPRGYYSFGPLTMRSGDLFGLFSTERTQPAEDHLIVYPEVRPMAALGLPPRFLIGDMRLKRSLVQDPMRMVGVREYTPGDSIRQVHWRATARAQRLQVKQLEATTSLDLLIFLNVSTTVPDWLGVAPALMERAVTTAASVADHALAHSYRVGLYANANPPGSDQQLRIEVGRAGDQRLRVLEALAKVTGLATVSMEAFLRRETRSLPWGATLLIVTSVLPEGMLASLTRLRRAGRQVAVVYTGDAAAPGHFAGIPVYTTQWTDDGELELA